MNATETTAAPAVHVCLVSEQLLPNLIPVLQERPAHVYLVVSPHMHRQAERLSAVLDMHGIPSLRLLNAPDAGLADIHACAAKVLAGIERTLPGHAIWLNATGGTKLMSIGFVDVFRASPHVARIFYTDTARDRLEMLHAREAGMLHPIAPDLMDIENYLAVQGMVPRYIASRDERWVARAEARDGISEYLATQQKAEFRLFVSALNKAATEALDRSGQSLAHPTQLLLADKQGKPRAASVPPAWHEPLKRLTEAGLLHWDGAVSVTFPDAASAAYLGGKWLEEHVWLIARELKPRAIAAGVQGEWLARKGEPPSNEIDVLLVHRNRMLIIECKTGQFGKYGQKDQDLINKLQVITENAGGKFGRGLLVSYNALSPQVRGRIDALRQIDKIEGGELRGQLTQYVRRWMEH